MESIRFLPAFSLFFAVASLGMPGTGNFVGEFMILFGTYGHFKLITIISVFGLVFASVYAFVDDATGLLWFTENSRKNL